MVMRWVGLVGGAMMLVVACFVGWQAAMLAAVGASGVLVGLFLDDGEV